MADYVRPTDFTKGLACPLCGWPNLKPGHNRKERELLRNDRFRVPMIAALGVIRGDR